MAPREQFLDDYENSLLPCDSDDSEDDRHSDDNIGLIGSEPYFGTLKQRGREEDRKTAGEDR